MRLGLGSGTTLAYRSSFSRRMRTIPLVPRTTPLARICSENQVHVGRTPEIPLYRRPCRARIGAWRYPRPICSAEDGAGTCARASLGSVSVECDIADRHVTIIETRPPWDSQGDWTQFPIARLRYTAATGLWSIYWRDRHLKFHEYTRKCPSKHVQALLDYIGSHEDPIFWG
jgi:hypothetical protein